MDPINPIDGNPESLNLTPSLHKKTNNTLTLLLILLAVVSFSSSIYLYYKNNLLNQEIINLKTQSISISDNQAIQIVAALPEVAEFMAGKTDAKIALGDTQDNSNIWSVQVYESFPDHNATFNWYKVDKVTGVITKDISLPQ